MRSPARVLATTLVLSLAGPLQAGEPETPARADGDGAVSRAEFDELRKAYEDLQQEVSGLRSASGGGPSSSALADAISSLQEEVRWVTAKVDESKPAAHRFIVTGFTRAGYTDSNEANSRFSAGFFPVFLFHLDDRLMFEAELHVPDGGEVELSYAQATYTANDWLTVGAGKFLAPFGTFQERLHPAWINKLPSNPSVYSHGSGLVPEAMTGIQARGATLLPNGESKTTYSVFLANGPSLVDAAALSGAAAPDDGHDDVHKAATLRKVDHEHDPDALGGLLDFESGEVNGNKSLGARLGFLPWPWLEIGGSYWSGKADPSDSGLSDVDFRILGFDFLAQSRESEFLKGNLELRAEWIFSDVDDYVLPFDNERDGGYVQLAYRPQLDAATPLNDLEFALRFDRLDTPAGHDSSTTTFGVGYWLAPSAVVKVAVAHRKLDHESDDTSLLLEFAMGF